jgi:hypothetical protein
MAAYHKKQSFANWLILGANGSKMGAIPPLLNSLRDKN